MKRILMFLMCLLISYTIFATSVPVVYLDKSSTNLEASSFIKKQAKSNNLPYKFTFSSKLSDLSGNEKVVVILNTGLASGTDPRISTYLNSGQNNQAIILVNLYSIGKNILMTSVTSANTDSGVDEISAASQWKKRDSDVQAMHKQWTEELFRLIQVKQEL